MVTTDLVLVESEAEAVASLTHLGNRLWTHTTLPRCHPRVVVMVEVAAAEVLDSTRIN